MVILINFNVKSWFLFDKSAQNLIPRSPPCCCCLCLPKAATLNKSWIRSEFWSRGCFLNLSLQILERVSLPSTIYRVALPICPGKPSSECCEPEFAKKVLIFRFLATLTSAVLASPLLIFTSRWFHKKLLKESQFKCVVGFSYLVKHEWSLGPLHVLQHNTSVSWFYLNLASLQSTYIKHIVYETYNIHQVQTAS